MWNLSVSLILAIAIGLQGPQSVLLVEISFNSEISQNVGLSFGEPMDNCDGPNDQNAVRLNQMGLTYVREDFVKSADVRFITLEDNQISDFSVDALRSVPNLSCLNIRKNRIEKNILLGLSHGNLAKLNLAGNSIRFSSETPWDVSLPRLTHLDLSDNNMGILPSPIFFQFSFPSLTHFYLSGFSFRDILAYIPPSTKNLYLQRCILSFYERTLPPHISALFVDESSISLNLESLNLKTLSIRNCKQKEVLYHLNTPNILDLDISSNDLRSLHTTMFADWKYLQRLSIENNTLSSFDALNQLRSLTDLSLNYNTITNITNQSIGDLRNLRRLHLRGNRISLIEENAFSNLYFLEKLDLSENQLTTLHSTWILSLKALSHLNLRSNLFTTIDDMFINVYINSMKHLYLGKNNFTRIEISSIEKMHKDLIIHVL